MSYWALYLDESGSSVPHHMPLPNGETPAFSLAGVVLPLEQWREYDRSYMALKLQFFKDEIDKSSSNAALWEFKGNRAIAPRNANFERAKLFVYKTLDLIAKYGGSLFATSFLKSAVFPTNSDSMYTAGLQIMTEAFDICLRERGSDANGIMILDSRMAHITQGQGLDYQVAVSQMSYLFGNRKGRELKRLREAPLFADSAITAGVQIADVVAALMFANIYQHRLAPAGSDPAKGYLDYTHTQRYWKQLHDLQFVSANRYEGYIKYGFREQDHRKDTEK